MNLRRSVFSCMLPIAVLLAIALLASLPAYSATPCCKVVIVDAAHHLAVAEDQNGQIFEFTASPAVLQGLQPGQLVYANFARKEVSLDGKNVSGAMTRVMSPDGLGTAPTGSLQPHMAEAFQCEPGYCFCHGGRDSVDCQNMQTTACGSYFECDSRGRCFCSRRPDNPYVHALRQSGAGQPEQGSSAAQEAPSVLPQSGQSSSGNPTAAGSSPPNGRDPGPPPCCQVTKVDTAHHVATARNLAAASNGIESFEFAIPCSRTRTSVSVGQRVWANFRAGEVSLDGQNVCSQMVAESTTMPSGSGDSGASAGAKHAFRENFSCDGGTCTCFGDADCNNMFSSGVCRQEGGVCSGPAVMCQCRQQSATAATPEFGAAPGTRLTVVSVADGQLLTRSQDAKEIRLAVSEPMAARLKPGDELTVRGTSSGSEGSSGSQSPKPIIAPFLGFSAFLNMHPGTPGEPKSCPASVTINGRSCTLSSGDYDKKTGELHCWYDCPKSK